MKKLKLLIVGIALFGTAVIHAQAKPEKKAKNFADEMTKVLSLNEKETDSVYKIQLVRFKESQAIESEFGDNPEGKKEKLKDLSNKTFNLMKKLLGEERQKQWKDYKSKN
jgi:hypothetical protein